jgi:threonine/homoserine/homoserine lactone efflux protein
MAIFFSALLLGYSGAMMPGPLLTYDIERSLSKGWKAGLLVPLGHVLLELPVVLLLMLGMGSFLNLPWPKIVILFVGGLVLLWFGVDMIRSAIKGGIQLTERSQAVPKRRENLTIIAKSALISLLNPYFLLWWATIGLGFLLANASLGIWGAVIFYLGHATADITWYFAVSLFCDRISRLIKGMIYRVVIALLGAVLVFFSVKFIVDGIAQYALLVG